MRYDADHKQKTREKVLDAAADAIRLHGPNAVGLVEIMAKAGLTAGGFYAHFESKDELVAHAIGRMFDKGVLSRIERMADRPPAEALGSYIDYYLSPKHRDSRGTGCPMAALAADLPRLPSAARENFCSGVERLAKRLAELLSAVGHTDAEDLALSMLAELLGALSLARAEPDHDRSNRMLRHSKLILKQRLKLDDPP